MKKSLVIFGICFLFLVGFVSASYSSHYYFPQNFVCSDFGVECGEINIYSFEEDYDPYSTHPYRSLPGDSINSGSDRNLCDICDSNEYCFYGNCINKNFVGVCERPENFDKDCSSIKIGSSITSSGKDVTGNECVFLGL